MKISLRNRELVIALCRVSSYFYEMAKQWDRFVVLFLIHLQVSSLKPSLWIILARTHCSLQVLLSLQVVAFLPGDKPKIEQRRKIVWISAQTFLQIQFRLLVLSKVSIAKTHEHIGAWRRIKGDKRLELLN